VHRRPQGVPAGGEGVDVVGDADALVGGIVGNKAAIVAARKRRERQESEYEYVSDCARLYDVEKIVSAVSFSLSVQWGKKRKDTPTHTHKIRIFWRRQGKPSPLKSIPQLFFTRTRMTVD
jgi:hypothetical protein